jgi:hypothetical protein
MSYAALAFVSLMLPLMVLSELSFAQSDPRFCGPPARDVEGRIIRDYRPLREFERLHPKPQDGREWYRDHVIPLACGGCDSVANLQWLHQDAWKEKMRWERSVYGGKGISAWCP